MAAKEKKKLLIGHISLKTDSIMAYFGPPKNPNYIA